MPADRRFSDLAPGIASRVEPVAPGLVVSLTYYPPCFSQDRHRHDVHQLSMVLAGGLREELCGEEHDLSCLALGFKPEGANHSDIWGPDGALIFTLSLGFDDLCAPWLENRGWREGVQNAVQFDLVKQYGRAQPSHRAEIIFDLLASAVATPGKCGSGPPFWLRQAKECIADDPFHCRVGVLARSLGVHRVHLSREFMRHFGLPPSRYRRFHQISRLVSSAMISDRSFTELALDAGFSDHSHAARAIRAEIGLSLSELRAIRA